MRKRLAVKSEKEERMPVLGLNLSAHLYSLKRSERQHG